MAMKRSMTRNKNHGDNASSTKRFNTCDNGDVAPWSQLNHDVLFLVMMQLGVIDFVAFSGVCKSWRSLGLSNKRRFMASRPPMPIWISIDVNEKECNLEDFKGTKFKTILPNSGGRNCVGLTCGYLVLYGEKTRDFWLVNPITRHQLHFPNVPNNQESIASILVFSPSISRSVLVLLDKFTYEIWFSIEGKGEWNHVTSTCAIIDLHFSKGKIYTLDSVWRLSEMRLNSKPKLTLLHDTFIRKLDELPPQFVSSGENLYVSNNIFQHPYAYELDFGEMKWVSLKEKTIGEYAFFYCVKKLGVAIKRESWAVDPRSQYKRYDFFRHTNNIIGQGRFFGAGMWYFPHECMNVNILDE